jgi:hypothetical protein
MRMLAAVTVNYADMEVLLDSAAGSCYTVLPAIVTSIDSTIEANEKETSNYRTVEPVLDIILEAQDGTPLLIYRKKYPMFRHITREEALERAFRNIEQDLAGELSEEDSMVKKIIFAFTLALLCGVRFAQQARVAVAPFTATSDAETIGLKLQAKNVMRVNTAYPPVFTKKPSQSW